MEGEECPRGEVGRDELTEPEWRKGVKKNENRQTERDTRGQRRDLVVPTKPRKDY